MSYDLATLRAELKRDEGIKLRVYRCTAGFLTIGVGRNLDAVGIRPTEARFLGITKESVIKNGIDMKQAMFLLDSDIRYVEQDLDKFLPWWRSMSPVRQRVLLNMTFNLGMTGMLKWKNTLAAMRAGNYNIAANGMHNSLWRKQVGARAVRLIKMMREG